jgi:hypothetical protein
LLQEFERITSNEFDGALEHLGHELEQLAGRALTGRKDGDLNVC